MTTLPPLSVLLTGQCDTELNVAVCEVLGWTITQFKAPRHRLSPSEVEG